MNLNRFLTVPLARPLRLLTLFTVATASIGGCGGGSAPTAGQAEPPPPPAEVISYASIAGVWVGEVTEPVAGRINMYPATLALTQGAATGQKVGTIDYGTPPVACGGNLLARKAREGADYAVTEQLTYGTNICRDGDIRLQLDTDETELDYKWYFRDVVHATATLTRQE